MFDVVTPLAVPFDVTAEPDTVAEREVDVLEAAMTGVVAVDFDPSVVSWIGPPMRVSLSALFFSHRVRLCCSKSLPTCSTRKR